MRTFAEIWERDARWLVGPAILSSLCHYMKGRSLVAVPDRTDVNQINIVVPLPVVLKYGVPYNWVHGAVPVELHAILEDCLSEAVGNPDQIMAIVSWGVGQQNTALTVHFLNERLRRFEQEAIARGELALWQRAAEAFGLFWWALPEPIERF